MEIRVSDFIADYLVKKGINHNFTVPGGGAMYLNSSFGHQDGMKNIYVQHEQTAAIAAEAYYRINNELPIVCCTTGPGGTNTLTGVLGAWLDSIPMLVISGQVKYSTTVRSTGYPMRIMGDQEFDIVNAVKTMTKYAEMITIPEMVKYHLDKALYLAINGRPGPVWLDIPQNVQNAIVDTDRFVEFDEIEMINTNPTGISVSVYTEIIDKIKKAKRPVFYAGVEIRTHGAYESFLRLIEKLNIPVVTSFDGIDLIDEDHRLYAGRGGDVGNRYGNWAVQNSDLLLTIGTRLGVRQISYARETWARESYVIMVHEDPLELLKPVVHVELPVRENIKKFIDTLYEYIDEPLIGHEEWTSKCKEWKENYPVVSKRHYEKDYPVNPYAFINELSKACKEKTVVVSANGSACVVGASAFLIKKDQRFIINSGCASMGYEIPAAIGAAFAYKEGNVICLAGDGSIQMNLQDLQTVVYHNLPIKIIVINNSGYHSMRLTQNNLFKGLSKIGIGPESNDLGFPDMAKIAEAYDIPYYSICETSKVSDVLSTFLAETGYAMCEVFVDVSQPFEPKPVAKKLDDGTIISPPLEDLSPFLSRDELKKIMIIPLVGEEQ
jgi:acetolactate synthase-1/2/3 large subunit